MKYLMTAMLALGLTTAPMAHANNDAFRTDLANAGIPPSAFNTLEMWANFACKLQPKLNYTDAQATALLPNDVAKNGITLTPAQAAVVWASTKRNIC